MSKLITRIKRLALALCLATPIVSWAETAMNPVTGEVELYTYAYVGDATAWSDITWRDADGVDHTDIVPQVDQVYDSLVIKQPVAITAETIEGWTFDIGLFNGANLTIGTLTKWQGGCAVRVGSGSKLTISTLGDGTYSGNIDFYVAAQDGIAYACDYGKGGNFNYYFAGEGSVAYQNLTGGNHTIKAADITLSAPAEKKLESKTLVSFSNQPTFTVNALVAIKDTDGEKVGEAVLSTINTTGTPTITTDNAVGTCELVQTSTGIDLYWVDGDPAALPAPTVYKPSISVNFTSGTALSTLADVGIGDYAVPGTSWNNLIGNNGSLTTVTGVDSTGAASTISGAKVTISGTRGYWTKDGLSAASDLRQAYIDDADGSATPTVVVEGIPYYSYKVVLYFSNDTDGRPFGHLTINGTNYKWDSEASKIVTCEGVEADCWGSSDSTAYTEGGNYLVFPAMANTDGKLTVVGHRWSGTKRAGFAAIQIVEVKPDAGEDGLVIEVSGDTEYTVSEAKELTGTVYVTGSGTLTLAGEAKIFAETINVGPSVVLNVNADRLDATTFTGAGTVVYDGTKPVTGKGWTDSENWSGTVWVKNIPTDSNERKDWDLAPYGNANSTLRFTNVNLFFKNATDNVFPGTVDIDGDGMNVCDGYGSTQATFTRLTGSGTLSTTGGSSYGNGLTINDASGFTGTITLTKYKVTVGTSTGKSANGILEIESGKSITVAGATAPGGFVVNGTLVANGTLASSAAAAVTGSGTVTFGGVPSPVDGENETKWWKNAGWTGTVEIKGASIAGDTYAFNDYGNASSTVKLTNCSGWLTGGYTCVPALEIGGTFTWNDGWSNLNNTFKVGTLKGSGTISIPNQGAATAVWQITDNWSGFTGAVVGNNNAGKRVLVFGSTLPSSVTAGEIYISEGATLNLDNASGAWWGVGMGFVVDGTVKASSRSKWGGGTYMQLGDTGVLELVSTSNTDDQNTEMGNITGTGTLKFSSTAGWRAYPKTDANMPATTLTIQTEVADSLILPTKNNGETVIGNLAGSKNLRSDWSTNGADGRILTVTQSKDTEWEGKFVANRITQFNVVAPAEGTPGTLTLSGTQSLSTYDVKTIPMQVDGSVNLTGTWVGNTTVAGTIGGTGTLTGDLTFSAGSTLKAFSSDEDGLAVSGTITYPDEGTVTVDVSALEAEADVALLTASGLDATKFELAEGAPEGATLEVVEGVLTLVVPQTKVTVTVPAVDNTTVTVKVGEDTIEPTTVGGNAYEVVSGSTVTITYAANDGYELSGTAVYTIENATEGSTITITDTTTVPYVASFNGTKYTSLSAAVSAWAAAGIQDAATQSVVLTANVTEDVTIPVNANLAEIPLQLQGSATINGTVAIADGATFAPFATVVLGGDVSVAGTLYRIGNATVSIGGDLTIADGATLAATTLDAVNPVYSVTGDVVVEGVLNISLTSTTLAGGTYKVVTGASVTRDEGADVVVFLNTVENDNWVLSSTATELTITGAAATVGGEKFATFAEAVAAANGVETITLLASASYTLTVGETLVVEAGEYTMTVTPPTGYKLVETAVSAGVVAYASQQYVARVQNPVPQTATYYDPVYYTSLAEAVANAESGALVTLLADDRVSFAAVQVTDKVPSNGSIVINKNLTINGAGFTVYGNTNAEILNATGAANPGYDMAADLVDGSNLLGFFVKSGNVTFTNITLTEFGDTAYLNKFGYTPIQTASAYTGTLTLTGVNFSKFNRTAVCVRGGTLSMTGGTIAGGAINKEGEPGNARYFQQPVEVRGGTATISGVEITGGADLPGNGGGAIVAWSSATLNNVVVDFTGYGVWSDGPVVAITGEGTSIEATVNALFAEEAGTITVAAGDFTGSLAVDSDPNSSIVVSGGTFDRDVTTFCAEGKKAYEDTPGVWTVQNLKVFTVTFDSNGGTDVAAQNVTDGAKAATPEAPTKADNTFAGWTLNSVAYDFDTPVTAPITLVATWTPVQSGIPADTTTKIPLDIDNDSTVEQAQAAADAKTVTVADAVKTALQTAGVEETAYQAYFTKTAVKNTATEAWEVLVEIAPAVEAEVNNSAVAALEGNTFKTAEDNADVNIGLTVKPGLYYGVVCGTDLGTLGSAEVTLELATATSKTFTVTKPTGSSTACFIKVVVSATGNAD